MKIVAKKIEDVAVYELHGSVEILNYSGFESTIKTFFKEGKTKKILLDCSKLEYLSSTGLRIFMTAYKQSMENGVLMVVCGLQGAVSYVFDVTGFSQLLNVSLNINEALKYMKDT